MEVSQSALARMMVCCFLAGIASGAFEGLLRALSFFADKETPKALKRLVERLWPPQCLWRRRVPSESETGRPRRVAAAIVTALEDVICLLAASVALLLILYATNDGQFRLSAVVTMLLGYLLYRVMLKRRLGVLLASVRAVLSLTGVWILAVVSYPARKLLAFLWKRTRPIRARIAQTLRAVRLTLKERAKKAPPQEPTAAASTRPPNGRHYFSKGSNKNNR